MYKYTTIIITCKPFALQLTILFIYSHFLTILRLFIHIFEKIMNAILTVLSFINIIKMGDEVIILLKKEGNTEL